MSLTIVNLVSLAPPFLLTELTPAPTPEGDGFVLFTVRTKPAHFKVATKPAHFVNRTKPAHFKVKEP